MIVADDVVTEQAERALQRVADAGGADVADVHWLGDVRRTEIHNHRFRLRGFVEKKMFPARGGFKRLREHFGLESKIQKARTGYFNIFAKFGNVQFHQHIRRYLSRIQFPRFGERHERVALVIAEFRIRTGANQNSRKISVRQNVADGGLQTKFNLFVRKHRVES